MENKLLQKDVTSLMNKGFERSAQSFSEMVKTPVTCANTKMVFMQSSHNFSWGSKHGKLMVIITEVIGELSGRSYLIIPEDDRKKICASVLPTGQLNETLEEAMLMEVDNIISAVVISQIANVLNIEVFGDVPQVQYIKADQLSLLLDTRIKDNVFEVLTCATTFYLNDHDIHLPFIWKLSSKILSLANPTLTSNA